MEIKCQFESQKDGYYIVVYNQQIPANVKQVKFVGQHVNGSTNADVTTIQFCNCRFSKVPQGLTLFFPNLQNFMICASNLRTLTKTDLLEYRNFKIFNFDYNQLEFLPGNLFEGFKNLEEISFDGNKLRLVEPQILNGLNKLTLIDFNANENYNIWYSAFDNASPPYMVLKQVLWDKYRESKSKASGTVQPHFLEQNKTVQKFQKQTQHVEQTVRTQNQQLKRETQAKEAKIQKLEVILRTREARIQQLEADLQTTSALQTFVQQDHFFKDFRIKIAEREFLVHKLLLAARSPTLAKMLHNNPEADCLNLVDIPVGIFEQILDFLYTDKLPIGTGSSSGSDRGTNFVHLFAAAGRLKIEELKNHAAVMIGAHIGAENALAVLKMSNKYGHAGLRMKAFEEIKRKYPKAEFKDEWMENYEKVARIIEAFEEREEAIRKMDEKFKKLMEIN